MATINVQQPDQTDTTPLTYVAASTGGDLIPLVPALVVRFANTSGSAITVTLNAVKQCNQGFLHNQNVTVPANGEAIISTIDNVRFSNSANQVSLTYSAVTGLSLAAFQAH